MIRRNCFGTTLGLASYFKLRGLTFDYVITADHPYLVVYIGKDVYLAGGYELKKLRNQLVERDGYKT